MSEIFKPLSEMTPEEIAALNAKTETELAANMSRMQVERAEKVTSALSILTEAIEAETISIPFGGKAGLIVLANPPKAVLKKLAAIASKAQQVESGATIVSEDEEKRIEGELAEVLEQIVVEPKATKREWRTYLYLDEVAARVIYYLGMDMARRQEEKKEKIESFRKDGRGSAHLGDMRTAEKSTIQAEGTE